jgi:hypothetical protein
MRQLTPEDAANMGRIGGKTTGQPKVRGSSKHYEAMARARWDRTHARRIAEGKEKPAKNPILRAFYKGGAL